MRSIKISYLFYFAYYFLSGLGFENTDLEVALWSQSIWP